MPLQCDQCPQLSANATDANIFTQSLRKRRGYIIGGLTEAELNIVLTGSKLLFPAGKNRIVGNPSDCKNKITFYHEVSF